MSREHFIAYVRRTLDDAQWAKFVEVWTKHEQPVVCPFIEAILADRDSAWRELTPMLPLPACEEMRDLRAVGRAMRRSEWWSILPQPNERNTRGELRFEGARAVGNTLHGEVGGQVFGGP